MICSATYDGFFPYKVYFSYFLILMSRPVFKNIQDMCTKIPRLRTSIREGNKRKLCHWSWICLIKPNMTFSVKDEEEKRARRIKRVLTQQLP